MSLFTLQYETLSEPLHNNTKNGKKNSGKKARNLLVHIVKLSTAVVKVDIKVINIFIFNSPVMVAAIKYKQN